MVILAIFALLFGVSASAHFEGIVQKGKNNDMSKNWAVLVAGSSGYDNYRHQADISHAYQILIQHGFHPEKIITMMYDDVAHDSLNPFPGKLFNNYSHVDVYKGVKVDYRGDMVNHTNFLLMMRGDQGLKQRGFKVLESTEEDNVFFNFADHGSFGLICFPNRDNLEATELQDLITEMAEKKRFKQFLIYIEACESASMFNNYDLPSNVYATTAADFHESSYAAFCDDQAMYTCLGDLYSVNWMNDTDLHSTATRTVEEQYETVKKLTTKSRVREFGDKNILHDYLATFQGETTWEKSNQGISAPPPDLIDSRKAHLVRHYQVLKRSNDPIKRRKAMHQINLDEMRNTQMEQVVEWIVEASMYKLSENVAAEMVENVNLNNDFPDAKTYASCYKSLVAGFNECFSMDKVPMSAKHYYKFRNLCKFSSQIKQSPEELNDIITNACDF